MFKKYLKFKQMKLLDSDPTVKWCPRQGCERFVKASSENQSKLTCQCGQEICGRCGNVYHGWLFASCNKAIDDQFDDWAKDKDVRFCPYCKARIEKAEGCNHMTCYYCEFQFCWICGGTYTHDHFAPLNPLGCGGMQFQGNQVRGLGGWLYVFFKRVISLIGLIIIAPFALVLGPPIVGAGLGNELGRACFRHWGNKGFFGGLMTIILIILGALIGAASEIIVIPGFVCLFLPGMLIFIIVERYKRHSHAKQRLRGRMQEALELQRQMDELSRIEMEPQVPQLQVVLS